MPLPPLSPRARSVLDELAYRDEPASVEELADALDDDQGELEAALSDLAKRDAVDQDDIDRWTLTDTGHSIRSRLAARAARTDPDAFAAFVGRSLDREIRWRREAWRAGIKVILPAWVDTPELAADAAQRIAEKLSPLLVPTLPIEVTWFREEGLPAPTPPLPVRSTPLAPPPPGGVYLRCSDGVIFCVPDEDAYSPLGVHDRCGVHWSRHAEVPHDPAA